mmetsp:Transcript_754/g.1523  ORF Transcript_754/g.1523 Transcript_754/m.1523 type:complete len:254 (+) Transcript_754:1-762(+)
MLTEASLAPASGSEGEAFCDSFDFTDFTNFPDFWDFTDFADFIDSEWSTLGFPRGGGESASASSSLEPSRMRSSRADWRFLRCSKMAFPNMLESPSEALTLDTVVDVLCTMGAPSPSMTRIMASWPLWTKIMLSAISPCRTAISLPLRLRSVRQLAIVEMSCVVTRLYWRASSMRGNPRRNLTRCSMNCLCSCAEQRSKSDRFVTRSSVASTQQAAKFCLGSSSCMTVSPKLPPACTPKTFWNTFWHSHEPSL